MENEPARGMCVDPSGRVLPKPACPAPGAQSGKRFGRFVGRILGRRVRFILNLRFGAGPEGLGCRRGEPARLRFSQQRGVANGKSKTLPEPRDSRESIFRFLLAAIRGL